jgi:hypothetical protein
MKNPFVVISRTRLALFAGLLAGMAGMACAQIPGPGQFGGQGQGGAPAGQYGDMRSVPMTQRGSYGPGYAPDTRNSPMGQRDPYGSQYPDRRNNYIDSQRTYGGASSQYPTDPRNAPLGQRGAYGSQGVSGVYGGSGSSYGVYGTTSGTSGYGAAGENTSQSTLDSRNEPVDPLHTYASPAVGQYPSDSRNPATGTQGTQPAYRPYGSTTGGGRGPSARPMSRSVSMAAQRLRMIWHPAPRARPSSNSGRKERMQPQPPRLTQAVRKMPPPGKPMEPIEKGKGRRSSPHHVRSRSKALAGELIQRVETVRSNARPARATFRVVEMQFSGARGRGQGTRFRKATCLRGLRKNAPRPVAKIWEKAWVPSATHQAIRNKKVKFAGLATAMMRREGGARQPRVAA